MPEFIKIYYLQSDKLGWLVNDLLFAVGIAMLFGSGKRKAKGFFKRVCLNAFAAWGLIIFGKSILYTFFSDAYTERFSLIHNSQCSVNPWRRTLKTTIL